MPYLNISGTIDGINTDFTLDALPNPADNLEVYRNGLIQTPGEAYVYSGLDLTFLPGAVPQPGDDLIAFTWLFPSSALSVACNNPPTAVVGSAYTHQFQASGGIAPYTWELIEGSLPLGLTLNAVTGRVSGVVTGSIKGNTVTFIPLVDGVQTAPSKTFAMTDEKKTYLYFFKTDVKGIDYSGYFSSDQSFEVSAIMPPEIVQTLPIAKQFDQIGPEEFFRYGKVIQIEFRLLADGGTVIPYNIYFNDASVLSANLVVQDGVDASYYVKLPKGTSGNIVRVELGPTDFNFHRFYMRFQVARSGGDTDLEWIQI